MNETRQRLKLWDLPVMDSRIRSSDVTLSEMIFGYFLGPFLVLAMTTVISTYYLTFYRTYDDILSRASSFLVLLPLISVIPMALANIIVGVILGRTQTRQGKARPLLFTAAPLLLLSGMVMFLIPYLSLGFRLAWMAITYNIFAAVANPVYSNAHYLMVSLSTRNLDQRGKLSVVANILAVAGNGLISSILMPVVLSWINSAPRVLDGVDVGQMIVQNRWQTVMGIFAVLAFIGCLLEYRYTRERITEEDISADLAPEEKEPVPSAVQLKNAASDKFWWIVMVFYALYQMGVMFKGGYVFNIFCHEFYTEGVHLLGYTVAADNVQALVALVGGVPLAAGMLFAWPVANKMGKRNFMILGCILSVLGSIICLLGPGNIWILLIGQVVKGFSSIPGAYIMMALFADVLDHLEARFGTRVDGVSMSVYSTILTVVNGLAIAFFNLFYDGGVFAPRSVASFFFLGFEIPAQLILAVILLFLTVEKGIREDQRIIAERKAAQQ